MDDTHLDPGLSLGRGHWLRWVPFYPDRLLNPQLAALPDVEYCTAIIRHALRNDDLRKSCIEHGFCEGAVTMDTPTTRELWPPRLLWQMAAFNPLTITPSIHCHCGDVGFITAGRWQPA